MTANLQSWGSFFRRPVEEAGIRKTSETVLAISTTWPMEVADVLDKCTLGWGQGWAGDLQQPQRQLPVEVHVAGIGTTSETGLTESATWPMVVADWFNKWTSSWGQGWAGGLPESQQQSPIGPWTLKFPALVVANDRRQTLQIPKVHEPGILNRNIAL